MRTGVLATVATAIVLGTALLAGQGSSSGFPDATNTGWEHTGVTLTEYTGSTTINVAGTTIDSKHFGPEDCPILVRANNVTIKRSHFECSGGGTAICNDCDAGGAFTNLLVEDVEIDLGFPVSGGTGISSGNYTARRVNVYGGENLLWAEVSTLIEDSYLHDIIPYDEVADPHTDGVQMPSPTSNVTIQHNTIYGNWLGADDFGNSAITSGESTNVLVDNNLLAGGGYALRCPAEPGGYTWTDNRFSRIFVSTVGGFGPLEGSCDQHIHSGNVIHETGESVD